MQGKLKSGDKIVFATHNKGKLEELCSLLAAYGIVAVSADELDLPEPEETGTTFLENAVLKAKAAARASGLPALADDSGLSIDALNGAPGIYSARWAGKDKNFAAAMQRVEDELNRHNTTSRTAHFICVLALAWPGGETEDFEGRVSGELIFPPRGTKGFGYDPIFVPKGETQTFAEMNAHEKRQLSHRARAFEKFAQACLQREVA